MKRKQPGTHKLIVKLLVRNVAESKNISRSTLARKADIQYSTVQNIWQNDRVEVSLLVLLKLAKALNVSINELYILEDEQ